MTTLPAFLQRLDVVETADERSIRRAYARELKLIDQEADPAGFQSLREAYDDALHWLRYRSDGDRHDAGDASASPPPAAAQSAPAPAPPATFDEEQPVAPMPSATAQAVFPSDEISQADAVFTAFLQRAAGIAGQMAATDEAPWVRELQRSLADDRLINIVVRDTFERMVAELLAAGWQPGHEALLPAAAMVFDWNNDRRRIANHGQAGSLLDNALEQRAMFDMQPYEVREQQRMVIERLRQAKEPSTSELVKHSATLETLIARFPDWLALIASVPRIIDWRERNSQVPAWRSKLTFTGWRKSKGASYGEQQSTIRWGWLVVLVFMGLVRVFNNNSNSDHRQPNIPEPAVLRQNSSIDELLERAKQRNGSGELNGAIALYDQAISTAPGDPRPYSLRAVNYYLLGQYQDARRDVERAERLDRSDHIMLRVRGLLAMQDLNYQDALADFTRIIQLFPNVAWAYTQRALAYEKDKQRREALADALHSIHLEPKNNAAAYLLAARLQKAKGEPENAKAQASALVAADSKNPEAYIAAAETYMLLNQRTAALDVLKRGAAEAPSVNIFLYRSDLLPARDLVGRRAAIDAALAIDPKNSAAMRQRGALEANAGNFDAAGLAYTAALETGPHRNQQQATLLIERGWVRDKQGKRAASEADFTAAQAVSKTALEKNQVCWRLATLNVGLRTALATCISALEQSPNYVHALDSKGFTLLRLGRYEEAASTYTTALAQRPGFASSLYGRGIAKRKLGRHEEASADIQAAAAVNPEVAAEFADYGVE